MKTKTLALIIISLFAIAFSSCTRHIIYEAKHDFSTQSWPKDSTIVFSVPIIDTSKIYHIFFHTRITGQYPKSNLFLFIDTELPNHQTTRDTLECILAEPSGKWLGKGFGSIWSNKIAYRSYIRFPYSGTYVFRITQAMRYEDLPYVLDAGLSIEDAVR